MSETKRWKIGDLGRILINIFKAAIQGKLLMRLKVDKYFPQILYTFFLCLIFILFNMIVENAQAKIESNRLTIKELSIECTQKEYELVGFDRRSTVSRMLKEKGSKVAEPQKPAIRID